MEERRIKVSVVGCEENAERKVGRKEGSWQAGEGTVSHARERDSLRRRLWVLAISVGDAFVLRGVWVLGGWRLTARVERRAFSGRGRGHMCVSMWAKDPARPRSSLPSTPLRLTLDFVHDHAAKTQPLFLILLPFTLQPMSIVLDDMYDIHTDGLGMYYISIVRCISPPTTFCGLPSEHSVRRGS